MSIDNRHGSWYLQLPCQSYFNQPMAFAQAVPVNREDISSQWRTWAYHNYNEDGDIRVGCTEQTGTDAVKGQ